MIQINKSSHIKTEHAKQTQQSSSNKTQYVIDLAKESLFQIYAKTTTEEIQTNLMMVIFSYHLIGSAYSLAFLFLLLCSYVSNYRANVFNETITMKGKKHNKNQLN